MPASTPPDAPRKRSRPEPSPAQRALGLLVRREHSRKELARKLAARGVSREDASEAVARMTAEGWQDDTRFAESLARMRAAGGHGPVRISAELETHGLDANVIAQALKALSDAGEDDWLGQAQVLMRRRYGPECGDDPVLRRKAIDFLIRRGFDAGTAHRAVRLEPES
jgi:regulatory protein